MQVPTLQELPVPALATQLPILSQIFEPEQLMLSSLQVREVQVPTEPVKLQAWQVPAQAELQQTPSTQKPEEHSEPRVQVSPLGFRVWVHMPFIQVYPAPQTIPQSPQLLLLVLVFISQPALQPES